MLASDGEMFGLGQYYGGGHMRQFQACANSPAGTPCAPQALFGLGQVPGAPPIALNVPPMMQENGTPASMALMMGAMIPAVAIASLLGVILTAVGTRILAPRYQIVLKKK